MNVDEFLKQVQPASKQSRLAPYLGDLIKLRESGCTLKQVQTFLKINNVTISIGGLAAYLQRQSTPIIEKPKPSNKRTAMTPATPEKNQPVAEATIKNKNETPSVGSHNPDDLTKIMSAPVDLEALSKFARRNRKT